MTKKSNVVILPTLEDHLTECESRYQNLLSRFDQIEHKINRIETGLEDIKEIISNSRYRISTQQS